MPCLITRGYPFFFNLLKHLVDSWVPHVRHFLKFRRAWQTRLWQICHRKREDIKFRVSERETSNVEPDSLLANKHQPFSLFTYIHGFQKGHNPTYDWNFGVVHEVDDVDDVDVGG